MRFELIDYIGLVGAAIVLFAFYRISVGQWTNKSLWYELDNIIGALLLGYYTWEKQAYVSLLINMVWLVVAVIGLRSIHDRHPKLAKKVAKKNSKTLAIC